MKFVAGTDLLCELTGRRASPCVLEWVREREDDPASPSREWMIQQLTGALPGCISRVTDRRNGNTGMDCRLFADAARPINSIGLNEAYE